MPAPRVRWTLPEDVQILEDNQELTRISEDDVATDEEPDAEGDESAPEETETETDTDQSADTSDTPNESEEARPTSNLSAEPGG